MANDPPEGAEDDRTTVEQPPEEEETNNGALTTPAREPPKSAAGAAVDERWEDGTTVDEATVNANPGVDGFGVAQEELTVDEPPKPAVLARLVVIAGNDTGREFVLAPGKPLTIGRATDNDIVLTDIAVSRKHLDLVWESYWILKDRGSGNGTLLNDRLEDGQCKLQHGDRIEIGHTVFRFDHVGSAGVGPELGWGTQNDDEASTVAGRSPPRAASQPKSPPPPTQPPTNRRAKTGSVPPPLPADRAKASLPPPRPGTPSQGGALSARLALPANPSASESAIPAEPSFLVAAGLTMGTPTTPSDSLSASMRSMTATAHVEPLSYSSGTLAPVPVYAHLGQPRSMRRPLAIGAAICAGVALIGVIAMLTTGDARKRTEPAASAGITEGSSLAAVDDGDADPTGTGSADPTGAGDPPADDPPADDPPVDDPVDDPPVVKDPAPVVKDPAPVVKDPAPVVKTPVVKDPAPVVKDKPKVVKDKPKVVKDKPKVVKDKPKVAAGGAEAAKKKAASLYAAKDFKGAAAAVRDAAATADEADKGELEKLASSYSTLASNMATGNASAASKPTDALAAFKKALSADKKLGGTHAAMIREKLAAVAPKAAAGFMAKGNYEAAKSAADSAVNYGAGSSATVTQVRESLERKAGELYASGKKLTSSKPDEAKALFRRVLKIVPPDSSWYTKAYKALNTRPATKDDDE